MMWFLIRNYFSLSKFMDVHLYKGNFKWVVSYKISHDQLNDKQKKLSDEFSSRLKNLDRT